MVNVKVKFRPSVEKNKAGVVYYQLSHNRKIRVMKTDYLIFRHEWDNERQTVLVADSERGRSLQLIKEKIEWDKKKLEFIFRRLENSRMNFTIDDIASAFYKQDDDILLFGFMQKVIVHLRQMGKHRTSEAYRAAFNSFRQFRKGADLLIDELSSDLLLMYEAYLHYRGITKNSSSFYMRILRAVYNRAAEKGLIVQCYPFRRVYTGIDKTMKRAVPLQIIRQMKALDLSKRPGMEFARDMFLFSFYTRGMSFVDMAYLRKKDLCGGILSYRRRKTGQLLFIRWEQCMQEIIDKYEVNKDSPYLLPIIKAAGIDERRQYLNSMCLINRRLNIIGRLINLQCPLSMYVARHSWATVAKGMDVPLSVISAGMGHDSETTTQIYLASLENTVVDNANWLILSKL